MLDTFQIMFRGVDGTEAVKTEVRAWLAKLTPLTDVAGTRGGHILIEATYQHHHGAGWRYQATVEMSLSGGGVVAIGSDFTGNVPSDDVYVAIRNVFRCLRRHLVSEEERRQRLPVAPSPVASALDADSIAAIPAAVVTPPESEIERAES